MQARKQRGGGVAPRQTKIICPQGEQGSEKNPKKVIHEAYGKRKDETEQESGVRQKGKGKTRKKKEKEKKGTK